VISVNKFAYIRVGHCPALVSGNSLLEITSLLQEKCDRNYGTLLVHPDFMESLQLEQPLAIISV
jgi:hypothetical protein